MTSSIPRDPAPTGLALYDRTARDAAATVISHYSTSFGLACRLLGPRPRPHVRSVYALVRVADEVVDGPAAAAGLTPAATSAVLDALEDETLAAIDRGFSANLVVHAFARTARECGIDDELVRPFFASMRTDLSTRHHDPASHDAYVYGSAEVVGLMCLRVFVNAGAETPVAPDPVLVEGARRLGAAFQDVNFLRDLDHDATQLGRDYLGLSRQPAHDDTATHAGTHTGTRTMTRTDVLDRIDGDLADAASVIPLLPADCRRAVTAAHDLFAELSSRLRAADGAGPRVRVPAAVKARLAARAWMGSAPTAPRGARA